MCSKPFCQNHLNVTLAHNYWQHPVWTRTIVGKRVQLVRPQAHHFPTLVLWFADKAFVAHYNAFIGNSTIRKLTKRLLAKEPLKNAQGLGGA